MLNLTHPSNVMTTQRVIVAVIAILLAGANSAWAGKGNVKEKVRSLVVTLEKEKDKAARKKAVDALLKLGSDFTPSIINALPITKSTVARDSLVFALSRKKEERAKKVLFNVLRNKKGTFSSQARESAVFGLSELTRVVNQSSLNQLKKIYNAERDNRVKAKLKKLVEGLEPFALKPNKFAKDPSSAQMHQGLNRWAKANPGIMDVTVRGKSVLGKPIVLVKITDKKTSDDNKAIVLFTSTHCGGEEIGATSLLHLTKWLLGDEKVVKKIREKVIVLIMPCVNPDGWDARRRSGRPYHSRRSVTNTAWNVYGLNIYDTAYWFGSAAKTENPEGLTILKVGEEFQPDASMDVHSAQRNGTMPESTGFSWGDYNAHSFQPLIVEQMNQALEKAGCLAERVAEDAGRIKVGSRRRREYNFYRIGNKQTIMTHLYFRYHTLAYNCEAAYDFAVVARARRLLEIGTETWRNEFYPGYPSRQLGRWGPTSIAAWGNTAKKRRKSRIEIWQKMNQILFGGGTHYRSPTLDDNRMLSICATTTKAAQKWIGSGTKSDMLGRLSKHKAMKFDYIRGFVQGLPVSIRVPPHYSLGYKSGTVTDEPIRHGMAMRLFIPYDKAQIYDARINGHKVKQSAVHGYIVRSGPGTIVQFNIPPGKVGGVNVVSLKYKVAKHHKQGFDQDGDWELKK